MTQPTPSEIARYAHHRACMLQVLGEGEGDYVLYTDHLTAHAADAAEIERLRAELMDAGGRIVRLEDRISSKAEAAAKEYQKKTLGMDVDDVECLAEIITSAFGAKEGK